MDFDTIITFLFIIAFFVLPSIFKQVQARKKKTAEPSKAPRKNPSLFDKIGEQIRNFIQELEEQAQQKKKASSDQGSEWDKLADEDDLDFVLESASEADDPVDLQTIISQEKIEPETSVQPARRVQTRREESCARGSERQLSGAYNLKSNPLQNAIIWSEILSKPLALRDK